MRWRWMRALAALTVFAMLFSPGVVLPCGPVFPSAVFYRTTRPDEPDEKFYRGELGILQSGYSSYYLVPAYRYLMGIGLNDAERRTFLPAIIESSETSSRQGDGWRTRWDGFLDDVKTPGKRPMRERHARGSGIYRIETAKGYYSYLNCHEDAFKTAVNTLNERIQMFGRQSQEVTEWVKAQEIVFSNCSKGHESPNPAPAGMPYIIQADRAYQIAAAHFYAGDFDQAEKLFQKIAEDKASPWHRIAPYLAARSLIRNATINGGYRISENPLMLRAETVLQSILQNNDLSQYHQPARDLLGYVKARLRPAVLMHELAIELTRKDVGPHINEYLQDYRFMLGSADGNAQKAAEEADDLTDWIRTFQYMRPDALDHALDRWEQTASLAWFVAAIAKMPPGHPKQQKLQMEADKLLPTSPAYQTAVYHSLRLLIGTGRQDLARKRLDALLSLRSGGFSGSSYNMLLSLRMKLSDSFDEFLQYAQRVPVAIGYDYGGGDIEDGTGDRSLKEYAGRRLLDSDSAAIINGYLPLSMLASIANNPTVAIETRKDIAMAAWTRAVLVDDEQAARNLVPALSSHLPELKKLLNDYAAASTREERRFTAAYLLLKAPGMSPFIHGGIGRTTPTDKIDNFRQNWWCDVKRDPLRRAVRPIGQESVKQKISESRAGFPEFISKEQIDQTEVEVRRLLSVEPGPNCLAGIVLPWARTKPDDPRVPEALHLLVKSTRYGCVDNTTTEYSKEAFRILHEKYPRSQWTMQTPHYF